MSGPLRGGFFFTHTVHTYLLTYLLLLSGRISLSGFRVEKDSLKGVKFSIKKKIRPGTTSQHCRATQLYNTIAHQCSVVHRGSSIHVTLIVLNNLTQRRIRCGIPVERRDTGGGSALVC